MARELSLPVNGHSFQNRLVNSYRCLNGVLNNPKADRRTTAGTFHIVEGGLPIPRDKRAVPKVDVRKPVPRRDATAAGPDDVALHVTFTSSRAHLGVALAATAGVSRGFGVLRSKVAGVSILCARIPGQQSRLRRIDLWQCG